MKGEIRGRHDRAGFSAAAVGAVCAGLALTGCAATGAATLQLAGSGIGVCGPAGPDQNSTLDVSALKDSGGDPINVTDVTLSRGTDAAVIGWFFWTTSSNATPAAGDGWEPPADRGAHFEPGSAKQLEIRLHRTGSGPARARALRVDYRQHDQPGSVTFSVDATAVGKGQTCTEADMGAA